MQKETGTVQVKRNFPEMLKGGVICDVVNAEQARIAEEAGASAVISKDRLENLRSTIQQACKTKIGDAL